MTTSMPTAIRSLLKTPLDRLYGEFNYPDSATDPIHIVRRFARQDDREIVGFCAAGLAFGRVASVIQSIERLLAVVGPSPAAYVRSFDTSQTRELSGLGHRWIRSADLVALIRILHGMLQRSGSIERFFAEGFEPGAPDVGAALDSFSTRAMGLVPPQRRSRSSPGVCYFFPRPSAGSACKRLNLFLRWMVRRDALDLGVWKTIPPSALVVPLDTHVIRVGRCLGLTRYTSPGWAMAKEITDSLRALDARDPVKYDFSICHLGMMNACGFNRSQKDSQCPLRGVCRPHARKPSRSPRPSVRR
jgi:uncharacterized protein (TIGR02757 family)